MRNLQLQLHNHRFRVRLLILLTIILAVVKTIRVKLLAKRMKMLIKTRHPILNKVSLLKKLLRLIKLAFKAKKILPNLQQLNKAKATKDKPLQLLQIRIKYFLLINLISVIT